MPCGLWTSPSHLLTESVCVRSEVGILGLLPFDRIHVMSYSTDALVYHLAHPINRSKGPVFRQGVPRVKREILTQRILLRRVEILLGNPNGCDLVKRGLRLIPFSHRIFDAHLVRGLRLT